VTLRAVHQAVAALSPGDALGRLTFEIRAALRDLGLRSEIFAGSVHDELGGEAEPVERLADAAHGEAVLLHYAIASPVTDAVLATDARRGLIYYNLTPEPYFLGVSRRNWDRVRHARLELPWLAEWFDVAVAHSEYSRSDLLDAGFTRTAVLPAIVSPPAAALPHRPEPALVLGVGRIAPHKRWELALRAMAVLRRDRLDAHFELVGSADEMEPYAAALEVMRLRLDTGAHVAGRVDDAALEAAYARATVLLMTSAHEGFGIPLLEAMIRGVPVVATAHGAVPEVLDGAGLLCGDDPVEIAATLATVCRDRDLQRILTERGRRRAAQLNPTLLRTRLRELVATLESS
jgi:glycosyltransferase involved in cell wall biosynthesis